MVLEVLHAPRVTATEVESRHFTWHCGVAALLLALPPNAATSSNLRHAIRKATETAGGKQGVLWASHAARKAKENTGVPWDKCALVKEHVIPVSEVCKRVIEQLASTSGRATPAASTDLTELLAKGDVSMIREDLRVKSIWQVIRSQTLLAWITGEEHALLAKRGLKQRMPADWDGKDPFARYRVCGIGYCEI